MFCWLLTLPLELQLEVASHLLYTDYINLRSTSKLLRIPKKPKLNTIAYFNSIPTFPSFIIDPSNYMDLGYAGIELFPTLIQYGHEFQCRRMLKRFPSMDQNLKFKLFELALLNNYLPNFLIDLIDMDTTKSLELNYLDNLPIQIVTENQNIKLLELLLNDTTVDPTVNNQTPLKNAIKNNNLEMVTLLLKDPRIDPSIDDNFCIRYASREGFTEMVDLLLTTGRVQPHADNNYCIQLACKNGHYDIVNLLLSQSMVDPSVCQNFALRLACKMGFQDIVERLLDDVRVNRLNLQNVYETCLFYKKIDLAYTVKQYL